MTVQTGPDRGTVLRSGLKIWDWTAYKSVQSGPVSLINALDYVSADHPLLPSVHSRTMDSRDAFKSRARFHTVFWWDVLLAIRERAQPNQAPEGNTALRAEVAKLSKEINELRKEKEQKTELAKKVEKLQKERDQDKVIIAYCGFTPVAFYHSL